MSEGLSGVGTEVTTDATSNDAPIQEQAAESTAAEPEATQQAAETPDVEPQAEPEAEHPDWFMKDKYKTVEDQAKAGYELQKKMGKNWGAPQDEYKLDEGMSIDLNDPLLKHLAPAIKEMGLSNEGFNNLVKEYESASMKMVEEMTASVQKDLKQNSAMEIQAVDKWLIDNFEKGERDQIRGWISSVEDFKTLNTLRSLMPAKSAVPSQSGQVANFESTDQITDLKVEYKRQVNSGERIKSKTYEDELFQRFNDAARRETRNR